MELILLILIVIAAALVYSYLRKRVKPKTGRNKKLWRECRRRLNLPPGVADETIARHIKSLQERHPGRSEEWYLEKIIYDLERDR